MSRLTVIVFSVTTIIASAPGYAAGQGQGGCSVRDDAPMYDKSTGDRIVGKVKLHECVTGITTRGVLGNEFVFERQDGRVHVAAFKNKEEKGMYETAWMDPADLSIFTFECGCGTGKNAQKECTPFQGLVSKEWNLCFLEARDKKKAALNAQGAGVGAPLQPNNASPRTEKALGNDDILSLSKVGLDDAMIVMKINQVSAVAFDVSTNVILALKTAGVSNAAIGAMMNRANKSPRTEKALGNDDILSLFKVGLDDAMIVMKINQVSAVAFDVSTNVILALKTAGVSNAIIDAMMNRANKSPGTEKALGNDDILSLFKVGLDDAMIVMKINQVSAVAFDLSTNVIVAMKTAGVSNAIIDAMMNRANKK